MTNGLSSSFVGLRPYSEYTFPVVNGRKPTSASSSQSCRCSVGAKDAMRRCILAQTIRWELYPLVTEEPHAHAWLEIQAMLGLAKNTIHAYGRGANDYLAFCQRTARPFLEATTADIIAYMSDMPPANTPTSENIPFSPQASVPANSTMHPLSRAVRLL